MKKRYIAEQAIGSTYDYLMDCRAELDKSDPVDTIISVTGVTEYGTITAAATGSVIDNSIAKLRVSGSPKIGSWSGVRMTITTAGGQVWKPLLEIKTTNT
jgi:hypothetical protein